MTGAQKQGGRKTKGRRISPARLQAFRILKRVEDEGAYASILLAAGAPELNPEDRALTYELVMGVLRWRLWLDTWIGHLSGRGLESLDRDVLQALRLGLYQLRFLNRVPGSAAVNESVNLAYIARRHSAAPFINAVLRRATREPEFSPGASMSDPVARAAVETSHPEELIKGWIDQLGYEEAILFATANNEPAPTAFRLGSLSSDEGEIIDELAVAGGGITRSKISSAGWRLTGAVQASRALASNGSIYFQDEASQLVAELLDPQPGEMILDACASPGSKATLIARLAGDDARIVATDIHPGRVELIGETVSRQDFKGIERVVADARRPPFRDLLFDRILVDAPCSGTGTLRRNPEIRWRLKSDDIAELAELQLDILSALAPKLKLGGRMIYSTCSVERTENEDVIDSFLKSRPDFRRVEPRAPAALVTSEGFVRSWPQKEGADGFFAAILQRVN